MAATNQAKAAADRARKGENGGTVSPSRRREHGGSGNQGGEGEEGQDVLAGQVVLEKAPAHGAQGSAQTEPGDQPDVDRAKAQVGDTAGEASKEDED